MVKFLTRAIWLNVEYCGGSLVMILPRDNDSGSQPFMAMRSLSKVRLKPPVIKDAISSLGSQADNEGSIPFTRSTIFKVCSAVHPLPHPSGGRIGGSLMKSAAQPDPNPRIGANPKICGGPKKSNISNIPSENLLQPA
jgi:hypothetical protein